MHAEWRMAAWFLGGYYPAFTRLRCLGCPIPLAQTHARVLSHLPHAHLRS